MNHPYHGLNAHSSRTNGFENTLTARSKVRLAVYDMLGRVIEILEEQTLDPGTFTTEWNAEHHRDGKYIMKLTTNDSSVMKKVVLIK